MNASETIEFRSGVVRPIECLKAGLELVRSQYWLFVGIIAVGMIIASVVPLGILMGPMMCGIYLTYFKQMKGQPVEFGDLFKGFDSFSDSLIATLVQMVPALVIVVPAYIFFYISMFAMMGASGGQPDPGVMLGFFAFWGLILIVVVLVVILISVAFTFSYPLIADRKLAGFDAVKLSMKAAKANFMGLLGLLLIGGFLGLLGVMLCYVGAFLVAPITFGAMATAYQQVFGLDQGRPNVPPPPPTFG